MARAQDRRRTSRHKVFEVAALRVGAETLRVHILDRSGSGARLHCVTRLPLGQDVVLLSGDAAAAGRICWVGDDGRLGVTF